MRLNEAGRVAAVITTRMPCVFGLRLADVGALKQAKTKRSFPLGARVLVGRSYRCDLRLPHPSVSGEHAVVWWDEGRWWIRDLGSRNGTLLDGERIDHTQRPLHVGATMQFGTHPLEWEVESIDRPQPMATLMAEPPRSVMAVDGLLALPSSEDPQAVIYEGAPSWILEQGDFVGPATNGMVVVLGDERWHLHLPQVLPSTIEAGREDQRIELGTVEFHFVVSADEEHVSLAIQANDQLIDLGSRAHHYALLTLARARLADAALPETSRGWVYQDEIYGQLQIDRERLNLLVFRARKQLAQLGVRDAGGLVERRVDSNQIRIGVARLSIQST
jgi:pSer/pThr/pTyr-binding forkhead associated (FHA) protein